MREDHQAKGRRYLVEGRLRIEWVDNTEIRAVCRGHGEEYALGYSPGGWWCNCPAVGRCAHLEALQLVAVRPQARRWMEAMA